MLISFFWNFGDGTTSTEQNPAHTYKMAGTYTVTLKVTNDDGSTDTTTKTEYISVNSTDFLIDGKSINRPTLALRLALNATKGRGWTKYTGEFPRPDIKSGTLKYYDDKNQLRQFVYDNDNRKYYEIGLRNGAAKSGLSKVYRDKEGEYAGSEIPCELHFREDTAEEEHIPIEHTESHVYIRPNDESNKGEDGYDKNGYRNNFELDLAFRVNGDEQDYSKTEDVPNNGDLVTQKIPNARRIQPIIRTATSEFKITGISHYYMQKSKGGSVDERKMTENELATEYFNPEIWISRYKNPLLNLATGEEATGGYTGLVEGADGLSDSALSFVGGGLSISNINLDGNFTIQMGLKDIISPATVLQIDTLNINIDPDLEITDGTNTINYDLTWNGWKILQIVKDGEDITIRIDGETKDTVNITDLNYNGTCLIMNGENGRIFDFRLYKKAINAEAFKYYYRDLTNNQGNALLKMY